MESTYTSHVISPCPPARACNWARIRCQVPSRYQRRNRPYTVCQGPYLAGTSRHAAPVRVRHRIPLMSWRFVHNGGRPAFLPLGGNGASTAHCSLLTSPRPTPAASHRSPPQLMKHALVRRYPKRFRRSQRVNELAMVGMTMTTTIAGKALTTKR